MGDFVNRLEPLVANGTIFDSHIKSDITATVTNLQTARTHLAGTGYDSSTLTRVDAVIAKLSDFRTHVTDQVDNFLYNITIFQSVYAGTNEYDADSYFASILGQAKSIASNAAPLISALNAATSGGSVSTPLTALETLAAQATTLMTNEKAALLAGIRTLENQADAIQFNTLINSPLGAHLMRKAGGAQVQTILDEREAEVDEEIGWNAAWDPEEPVSDDPSQWVEPGKADPTR